MNKYRFFTSESVTEGHPDKMADQVSDAILDAILVQDPTGRVALETLLTKNNVYLAGEITSAAVVDYDEIARRVISDVGYNFPEIGCNSNTCTICKHINRQSPDIAMGVDTGGAGDQGMMFGYATNETAEYMPLPITIAHAITRKLTEVRRSNPDLGFLPDGKAQITIGYDDCGNPESIKTIVVSTQHINELNQDDVKELVDRLILDEIYKEFSQFYKDKPKLLVNPTGSFVIGGPEGDTGLTGRKIIVDTYGGMARHGGGAFSGKDPSKVDRSASYIARYIAKNVVAAGLADKCEIQIAYAIGEAEPVSVSIDTFDTGHINDNDIIEIINNRFDLTPKGIIDRLELRRPIYRETAKNGHFGNPSFPWEKIGALSDVKL